MIEALVLSESGNDMVPVLVPLQQVPVDGPDKLHSTLLSDKLQSRLYNGVIPGSDVQPTPSETQLDQLGAENYSGYYFETGPRIED